MKNSIHPALVATIIVIVVGAAIFFLYRGMEPQRESNALSAEEINKQMQSFNKTGKPPTTK